MENCDTLLERFLKSGFAICSVLNERKRQDKKWGVQDHTLEWWLAILMEEVGEMAEAILETHFKNTRWAKPEKGGHKNIRFEAVQVAAVALAMIECIDRDKKGEIRK